MRARPLAAAMVLLAAVGACEGEQPAAPAPPPDTQLSREETGYFCGMIVADHSGPKSQIRLAGEPGRTLWFTSVRDGIAYTLLPEETAPIAAFYVTAVAAGEWEHPEANPDNWIAADSAWYVIGSERRGGMGAAEAIPFNAQNRAARFSEQFGGEVVRLADIPRDYILGPDA